MNNLIEAAVSHLKSAAVERATEEAVKTIDRILADLEANGWDLKLAAPRPNGHMSRKDYREAGAKVSLYNSITHYTKTSLSPSEPNIRLKSEAAEAKFIDAAREDAAFQYEAFIAKLNDKIGEVSSATLEGNHVWGYSFLTVETADGETQIWKTQMIINVSKLGKLFNQFPTRKVKSAI